jgi:hypothetical protein
MLIVPRSSQDFALRRTRDGSVRSLSAFSASGFILGSKFATKSPEPTFEAPGSDSCADLFLQ